MPQNENELPPDEAEEETTPPVAESVAEEEAPEVEEPAPEPEPKAAKPVKAPKPPKAPKAPPKKKPTKADAGVRVAATKLFPIDPRGTVVESVTAEFAPADWPLGRQLIDVQFDIGHHLWVPAEQLVMLGKADVYEEAFANPAAFFDALASKPPRDQGLALAQIGRTIGMNQRVNLDGGAGFMLADMSQRFAALLRKLPPERAFGIPTRMLAKWVDAPEYASDPEALTDAAGIFDKKELPKGGATFRLEDVAEILLASLAWLVLLEASRQKLGKIADRFGDDAAKRLRELLPKLSKQNPGGRWFNKERIAFLQAALDKLPGTLPKDWFHPLRLPGSKLPLESFGVKREGFVVRV